MQNEVQSLFSNEKENANKGTLTATLLKSHPEPTDRKQNISLCCVWNGVGTVDAHKLELTNSNLAEIGTWNFNALKVLELALYVLILKRSFLCWREITELFEYT